MDDYINRLENNDPTLVELILWRNIIDMKRFVESLKNNTYLQYLDIHYDKNYLSVDEIIEILTLNIGIRNIIIHYVYDISENSINEIFNSLKMNTRLQILDIGIGNINNKNAVEIAMLIVNTTLQELIIHNNYIGNGGLVEIINALRMNTSLKVLDVCFNEFENDNLAVQK